MNDEAYESQREKMGDSFYPGAGDIITTGQSNTPLPTYIATHGHT